MIDLASIRLMLNRIALHETFQTPSKRHIVVDVLGLILAVAVTGANVQDRDGGQSVCVAWEAHGKVLVGQLSIQLILAPPPG
jgi:hypothetical protein